VILAAALADLGVRFGVQPDFRVSLWVEAAVFLVASGVLLALYRRAPAAAGWTRGLQVVLIASFGLAALRSAIWASGRPVTHANLVILVLGLAAWIIWRRRDGRRREAGLIDKPVDAEETGG
jgi:hypothetical protein